MAVIEKNGLENYKAKKDLYATRNHVILPQHLPADLKKNVMRLRRLTLLLMRSPLSDVPPVHMESPNMEGLGNFVSNAAVAEGVVPLLAEIVWTVSGRSVYQLMANGMSSDDDFPFVVNGNVFVGSLEDVLTRLIHFRQSDISVCLVWNESILPRLTCSRNPNPTNTHL